VDSQSVKTTEESVEPKRCDAHNGVKSHKRHVLVDTSGLLLSVFVTAANAQDRVGARGLLAGLGPVFPRLERIWADGAYGGARLSGWCEAQGGMALGDRRAEQGSQEL
jgi:putative transposase